MFRLSSGRWSSSLLNNLVFDAVFFFWADDSWDFGEGAATRCSNINLPRLENDNRRPLVDVIMVVVVGIQPSTTKVTGGTSSCMHDTIIDYWQRTQHPPVPSPSPESIHKNITSRTRLHFISEYNSRLIFAFCREIRERERERGDLMASSLLAAI